MLDKCLRLYLKCLDEQKPIIWELQCYEVIKLCKVNYQTTPTI